MTNRVSDVRSRDVLASAVIHIIEWSVLKVEHVFGIFLGCLAAAGARQVDPLVAVMKVDKAPPETYQLQCFDGKRDLKGSQGVFHDTGRSSSMLRIRALPYLTTPKHAPKIIGHSETLLKKALDLPCPTYHAQHPH